MNKIRDFIKNNYILIFMIAFGIFATITCIMCSIKGNEPIKIEENTIVKYNEQFNLIEKLGFAEYIVFDKDTNVIYYIYDETNTYGITPLYNADGTIQVYNGGK